MFMEWKEIFEYRDGTLHWKIRPAMRVKIGDVAGTEHKGYIQVNCKARTGKNKIYRAHRIVWEMFNGELKQDQSIDHINGNRKDNRIENLRVANHSDNMRNRKVGVNAASGVLGVAWHKPGSKWVVHISKNGKWSHVGYFEDFEDAVKARKQAELEFNYHENHGKR